MRPLLFFTLSDCSVVTLMRLLLSALIVAQFGLQKILPGVIDLVSQMVSIKILFHVREVFEAAGFFQINLRCSSEASLAFLAYRHSPEIDWGDVCCVR